MKSFQRTLFALAFLAAAMRTAGQAPPAQPAPVVTVTRAGIAANAASPRTIEGTVTGPGGEPVAGVSMTIRPQLGRLTEPSTTDSSGHYQLTWDERLNFDSSILARSQEKNLAALTALDAISTHFDVKLQPGLALAGKVQDPSGKAITNASANVYIISGNGSYLVNDKEILPDSQGSIEVQAMPQGQRYALIITASGYGKANVQVDASQTHVTRYEFPPCVLPFANLKLGGRVLDQNGNPAAGVLVRINGQIQPMVTTNTDDKGRFFFDAVCDGPVNVIANAGARGRGAGTGTVTTARGRGNLQTVGGDTNITLRLGNNNPGTVLPQPVQAGNGPTITGKVTDASGAPVAGATVTALPNYGINNEATTAADGSYSVTIENAQNVFRQNESPFLMARSVSSNLVATHEFTQQTTNLDLQMEPGREVSGAVEDTKQQRLPDAQVQIYVKSGNNYSPMSRQLFKVDDDGSFTIKALPPGADFLFFVRCPAHGTEQRNIGAGELHPEPTKLPVFTLKIADRRLEGKVVDANNNPVTGARVQMSGPGQPNGMTTSDSNGHFVFKQVCEGNVRLYALPGNGGAMNIHPIQALGGDLNVVLTVADSAPQATRVVRNGAGASAAPRFMPLKPPPWTWASISLWPMQHQKATAVLLYVQMLAAAGTAVGIFLTVRKK